MESYRRADVARGIVGNVEKRAYQVPTFFHSGLLEPVLTLFILFFSFLSVARVWHESSMSSMSGGSHMKAR